MGDYYDKYMKYKSKYLMLKGGNNNCIKCIMNKIDNIKNDQTLLNKSVDKKFIDIDDFVNDDVVTGNTLGKYVNNLYSFLVSDPVVYQLNKILNNKTKIDYDTGALYWSNKINSYYDYIKGIILDTKNIVNNIGKTDGIIEFSYENNVIMSLFNNYKNGDPINDSKEMQKFVDDINRYRILLGKYNGHKYDNAYRCNVKNIKKYIENENAIIEDCKDETHSRNIYVQKQVRKIKELEEFIDFHNIRKDVSIDASWNNLSKYSNKMLLFFTEYQKKYLDFEKQSNIKYIQKKNSAISNIRIIIDDIKKSVQNNDIKIIDEILRKLRMKNNDIGKLEIILDELDKEHASVPLSFEGNNGTYMFYRIGVPNIRKLVTNHERIMKNIGTDMNNKKSIAKIMDIYNGKTQKYFRPNIEYLDEDFIEIDEYFIILKLLKYNIQLFRNNYSKNKDYKYPVNIMEEYLDKHIYIPIDDYKIDTSKYKIIDLNYPIGRESIDGGHGTLLIKYNDDFIHFDSNYYTEHYSIDFMKNIFGENKFKLLGPDLKSMPYYGIQTVNEGYSYDLGNICYTSRNKNPLGGNEGFCASWSQYIKLMLSLNNDKIRSYEDMVEMVRYIIHTNNTEIHSEKNKVILQRKLFKSMMLVTYILINNNVVGQNILSNILQEREMKNLERIMANIRSNIDKIRSINKYVYNILI